MELNIQMVKSTDTIRALNGMLGSYDHNRKISFKIEAKFCYLSKQSHKRKLNM